MTTPKVPSARPNCTRENQHQRSVSALPCQEGKTSPAPCVAESRATMTSGHSCVLGPGPGKDVPLGARSRATNNPTAKRAYCHYREHLPAAISVPSPSSQLPVTNWSPVASECQLRRWEPPWETTPGTQAACSHVEYQCNTSRPHSSISSFPLTVPSVQGIQ